MHKRLLFLSIFLVNTLFAQQVHLDVAISYFEKGKYSLAQNLFENIPNSEDAKYYSAICAKMLFASDALDQLNQFLDEHPYSLYRDDIYLSLSDIFYRKKEYKDVIRYYKLISQPLTNEHRFKLAYSYFCINLYNEASYHFSFLINHS